MTEELRVSEERQLRELAQQLRDLSTSTAGAGHEEAIVGFASQAESYADQIRDASSPEAVTALVATVARKRSQWTQLMELLSLAGAIENSDDEEAQALAQLEAQLRSTAEQLRAVASGGTSEIFNAIGRVASEAEAGLAEFLAAETKEDKMEVFARASQARERWLGQMEGLQSEVLDGNESQAPTEAPDASDPSCEYVDDFQDCEETSCRPAQDTAAGPGCSMASVGCGSGGYQNYFASNGCTSLSEAGSSSGCRAVSDTPIAAAASSDSNSASSDVLGMLTEEGLADIDPAGVREQIAIALSQKDDGLLDTLRRTVAKVQEDERFEGVHKDAGELLAQMELASGALIPEALVQEFPDDLAGAEERLKSTVEPMRKAQWGGFYAKKAAFTVQKYDLYVAKGKMPKLKDEHSELLACAKVCVDVAGFLHKEARNAIMDSVTGLVAQASPISSRAAESTGS